VTGTAVTGTAVTSTVLIGFMGAGKSTVGRLLAGRLGHDFVDSDDVVEQRAGRAVREIFEQDGEPAFRELEHQVIADLLAGPPLVLALGGGAVGDARTRALLAGAQVVYLRTSYRQALARVGGDPGRPMLRRPDLELIYTDRATVYAQVADVVLDTDLLSPEEVARQLAPASP